ncbi:MAG: flagellar biosynthesis protein FlhB [Spirochaetes bacterium GWF1_51_8]|nr:MAG: flagellar biosynthesis protein FlhB [Spirochaetes bacterium GWF1_51_8]
MKAYLDENLYRFLGLSDLSVLSGFRYDLQRFAAEDEGRTEEPTQQKKRKAREEGNVPKSQELVAIIVFLLTFWTACLIAENLFGIFKRIMTYYFQNLLTIQVTASTAQTALWDIVWMMAQALLPLMLAAVISSLLSNLVQGGFIFSTKKITLDFSKIFKNIGPNLKKMFWSVETLFNLIKSLFKVTGVFAIAFLLVNANMGKMLQLTKLSLIDSLTVIATLVFEFVTYAGVMLLIFALADYAFQRWVFTQSLKMSKQEIKQEFKDTEGNPEIKARIAEMGRRLLRANLAREVPKADVVITNPTHIAIALKYDPNYMNAPIVLAKGEGVFAQRIKELAKDNNIMVIENKPLARELFARVEVGEQIPFEFFQAVAKILSLVFQTRSSVAA